MTSDKLVNIKRTAVAAVYRRVSDPQQARSDKTSLDDQLRLAKEACSKNGWRLEYDYCDPGISNEDLEHRVALQQMLQDARQKLFDVLIVYNGDRLARRLDIAFMISQIIENECLIPIYDLSNPLPVDPHQFNPKQDESRLFTHGIRSILSQADQQQRVRRMASGKRGAVSKGKFIQAHAPYGYRIEYRPNPSGQGKPERIPVPDPAEFPVVQEIFSLVSRGFSDREIADHLTKTGAPPPGEYGWNASTLGRIIKNPFYAGVLQYGRSKRAKTDRNTVTQHKTRDKALITAGEHSFTKVLSLEEFEALQARRKDRAISISPRARSSANPLAGILKCGKCGGNMVLVYKTGSRDKIKRDYFCCGVGRHNSALCDYHNISFKAVLDPLFDFIRRGAEEEATNPAKFYAALELDGAERELASLHKEIEQAEKKLAATARRLDSLLDNLVDGVISREQYAAKAAQYNSEKETAESQLAALQGRLESARVHSINKERVAGMMEYIRTSADYFKDTPFREWNEVAARELREQFRFWFKSVSVKGEFNQSRRKWEVELDIEPNH